MSSLFTKFTKKLMAPLLVIACCSVSLEVLGSEDLLCTKFQPSEFGFDTGWLLYAAPFDDDDYNVKIILALQDEQQYLVTKKIWYLKSDVNTLSWDANEVFFDLHIGGNFNDPAAGLVITAIINEEGRAPYLVRGEFICGEDLGIVIDFPEPADGVEVIYPKGE